MHQAARRATPKVRRLLVAFAVLALSLSFAGAALADDQQGAQAQAPVAATTLTIDYTCTEGCTGTTTHTYTIAIDCDGRFTGTGTSAADATVTEQVSGRIEKGRGGAMDLALRSVYTGTNAGYKLELEATIDSTGAITGHAESSLDESFTVSGSQGAVVTSGTCTQGNSNDENDEEDD